MKIRLLGWAVIEGSVWKEGSHLEIDEGVGKVLIEQKLAEEVPADFTGIPGGDPVEYAVIQAPEVEVSPPAYYKVSKRNRK